jgi:hypothetical protein
MLKLFALREGKAPLQLTEMRWVHKRRASGCFSQVGLGTKRILAAEGGREGIAEAEGNAETARAGLK